jgi:hypothetical protein
LEKFFKRDKGTCLPSETVTYPNEMTMWRKNRSVSQGDLS